MRGRNTAVTTVTHNPPYRKGGDIVPIAQGYMDYRAGRALTGLEYRLQAYQNSYENGRLVAANIKRMLGVLPAWSTSPDVVCPIYADNREASAEKFGLPNLLRGYRLEYID